MRIRLIHWNAAEAEERADRLRAIGCEVESDLPSGPEFLRAFKASLPDAVVVDLSRIPSQGRDVALALRATKATRQVPIVFVEGDAAKRAGVARNCRMRSSPVGGDPRRFEAGHRHPRWADEPTSALAGYSGTPLPKKLGIKTGSRVALIGAPADFAGTLGPLPEGAQLSDKPHPDSDLVLWFIRSGRDLERGIAPRARALVRGSMWIVWPKKASAQKTDLVEQAVRRLVSPPAWSTQGLRGGRNLVGLLFTRRKPPRGVSLCGQGRYPWGRRSHQLGLARAPPAASGDRHRAVRTSQVRTPQVAGCPSAAPGVQRWRRRSLAGSQRHRRVRNGAVRTLSVRGADLAPPRWSQQPGNACARLRSRELGVRFAVVAAPSAWPT
jgi:CheY-like chemotaxis protein